MLSGQRRLTNDHEHTDTQMKLYDKIKMSENYISYIGKAAIKSLAYELALTIKIEEQLSKRILK